MRKISKSKSSGVNALIQIKKIQNIIKILNLPITLIKWQFFEFDKNSKGSKNRKKYIKTLKTRKQGGI